MSNAKDLTAIKVRIDALTTENAQLKEQVAAADAMADAIYEHDLMGDRWNIPPAVYSTMLSYRATKPETDG